MLFAINYSLAASALLAQKRIQVDRFKCPNWPDMIAEAIQQRPVAVHFNLRAGSGDLGVTDWSSVDNLLQQTSTPYLNLHMEASSEDFPHTPQHSPDPQDWEPVISYRHPPV